MPLIPIRTRSKPKKKVMFRDMQNPPQHYSEQQIESLCLAIQNAYSYDSTSCIGLLVGKENPSLRVWPPTSQSSYLAESVSLEKLLTLGTLEKRDLLKLGAQLASAAMQLHGTVWLNEIWGKRDIFFPQCPAEACTLQGKQIAIGKPILSKPFVRRIFESPTRPRSPQESDDVLLLIYNKSLASLGIILVELWFGKRLEDLPGYPQGLSSNNQTICSDFVAASQLLETIQNEAGDMYGGAVRRCIRGIDHRATSLEDESFMNEVHAKIVSELERNWQAYISQDEWTR